MSGIIFILTNPNLEIFVVLISFFLSFVCQKVMSILLVALRLNIIFNLVFTKFLWTFKKNSSTIVSQQKTKWPSKIHILLSANHQQLNASASLFKYIWARIVTMYSEEQNKLTICPFMKQPRGTLRRQNPPLKCC